MAFYDNEVYDSWGGTGVEVETIHEYYSLDEVLDILIQKGISIESKEEKLLVINTIIEGDDLYPYLIRKDKKDGKYKVNFSIFGSYGFCDIRTNIKKLDYSNNKAIGYTYNGNYFTKYRKKWDYECPLKYLYMNISAPLNIQHNGVYVNLIGSEAIVTNGVDGSIISRHKTSIDECIELAKARYYRNPIDKNGTLTEQKIEKIIRKLEYIKL